MEAREALGRLRGIVDVARKQRAKLTMQPDEGAVLADLISDLIDMIESRERRYEIALRTIKEYEGKLDTALGLLNVAYAALSDSETRVARGFAREKIRAFARTQEPPK